MLKEAYLRANIPDYKVVSVRASRYRAPRGYTRTDGEVSYVGPDRKGDKLLGLSASASEADGNVVLEILDPGYTRDARVMGSIEHVAVEPTKTDADADYTSDFETYYESSARIEGPSWDNLPVTVRLRFADGVVVEDQWDGKAYYREYRVVRKAPLQSVVIDPDYRIRVDIAPLNNGLSREVKGEVPKSWSRWMMALYQAMAEGASSWL
jgi:hypothetical protein